PGFTRVPGHAGGAAANRRAAARLPTAGRRPLAPRLAAQQLPAAFNNALHWLTGPSPPILLASGVRQQTRQFFVLLAPDSVHPLLEAGAGGTFVFITVAGNVGRERSLAHQHAHRAYATGQQVDHGGAPARIGDGHVEDAVQRIAHRVEYVGHAPGLGFEQVPVRRDLACVLVRRETGAL